MNFVTELRWLLASCNVASQRKELIEALPNDVLRKLRYEYRYWAREKQLEPEGEWDVWFVCAGRGFGKTWTGAQWVIKNVRYHGYRHVGRVGGTASDARDVMVEGPSGILACSPPDFRPNYEPSKRRLTWPNGTTATTFAGDKPDQLRGPNRDLAWVDEALLRNAAPVKGVGHIEGLLGVDERREHACDLRFSYCAKAQCRFSARRPSKTSLIRPIGHPPPSTRSTASDDTRGMERGGLTPREVVVIMHTIVHVAATRMNASESNPPR